MIHPMPLSVSMFHEEVQGNQRNRWTAFDLQTERELATIFCRYPRQSHLNEPPYYPWVYHHKAARCEQQPLITFNLGYNAFSSSSDSE